MGGVIHRAIDPRHDQDAAIGRDVHGLCIGSERLGDRCLDVTERINLLRGR
jgi:hypothetical protein